MDQDSVTSRFVTQDEVDAAKARRDEQWKAAYARLGQDPPPQQHSDEPFDGRSLAEKLAANKIAKQEEWEEKTKLANQFRALEEDEIMFLDSIREKQMEEERQRKQIEGEEVKNFRQAVAARMNTAPTAPTPPPAPTAAPKILKKDAKPSLKGLVKKKSKVPQPKLEQSGSTKQATSGVEKRPAESKEEKDDKETKEADPDAEPSSKRRKTGAESS